MRLPWNRKYIEICFHVILTVLILAGAGVVLLQLGQAKIVIKQTAGVILAVFAPVLWAGFFSVLLEPMVGFFQQKYEKRKKGGLPKNRKAGTVIAYVTAALGLILAGGWFGRKIGNADLEALAMQISGYIRQAGDILVLLNLKLAEYGILQNVEGLLFLWTEQVTAWIERKILELAGILPILGNSLLDIVIGATVAFYFLVEKNTLLQKCYEIAWICFGKKFTKGMRGIALEVYTVFSGYLSGQLLDAAIMSVLFSAAFLIVGLPYAVVLGLISGFSNMIPYFGAITAFVFSVFAGLLSGTPLKAVYASILILLLQQVDSIFIVPKAVGKRVELHPAAVLLSLSVFGQLFGFWGLLLAVPLGALCKSGLLWLYEKRKQRFF